MIAFDHIVMAVGVLLIIIGLILFIIGKKESDKSNNVEGFGIKLNVSNPSVILIVLGCGLMLVPRLLPEQKAPEQTTVGQRPAQATIEQAKPAPAQQTTTSNLSASQQGLPAQTANSPSNSQAANVNSPAIQPPVVQQGQNIQPQFKPKPAVPQAYFPSGRWQLASYEENGVNLSNNVSGELVFSQQATNSYRWSANLLFMDGWGNVSNYQYHGITNYNAGAYTISFTSSTDPSFMPQNRVPLDLKTESGGLLHMGYRYNNSQILLHWRQ